VSELTIGEKDQISEETAKYHNALRDVEVLGNKNLGSIG